MTTQLRIPEELTDVWGQLRQMLMGSGSSIMTDPPTNNIGGKVVDAISEMVYPREVKDAFVGGIAGLEPGMIASNFRSPTAIQELRKLMAEEMRSRGPVGNVSIHPVNEVVHEYFATKPSGSNWGKASNIEANIEPDPIDQILRGSWYHGSSPAERDAVRQIGFQGSTKDPEFAEHFLRRLNEVGFQGSTHSGGPAISNVLGEPYGTSLTMLPTKGVDFTKGVDEYIHRVLPQYGGPPTERTVNLMTPEGRKVLNDAYDVVYNKHLTTPLREFDPEIPLQSLARRFNSNFSGGVAQHYPPHQIMDDVETGFMGQLERMSTSNFNKALSEQLQSQGRRGILYNPHRWNEYEMLMLDPKYALPLDYRKGIEYIDPLLWYRTNKSLPGTKNVERTATPGIRKGLSQIQDLMSQNKSRLGDIYSERPWTQRLSDENKRRLLDLIDPQYREAVGNQLSGSGGTKEIASEFDWDNFAGKVMKNVDESKLSKVELPGFKNIFGVQINKNKGFSHDTGDLYEDLIDIPTKELKKIFTSFDPSLKGVFQPGASKWDTLGGILEDFDMQDKGAAFAHHLNSMFGVGQPPIK